MGFSNLPLELTDGILGHLFPPNTKPDKKLLTTLASCNVALNSWAVPRLFKEVEIRIKGKDQRLKQLHQILDGRPTIATLVGSFTLHLVLPSTDEYSTDEVTVYKDTHLPAILPQLQNLTHFSLTAGSLPNYSPIDWDLLSKSWNEALQNVCLLPLIRSVELGNHCLIKSGWILHCKNLQDLGMWGILDSFGDPQGLHPWKDLDIASQPRLKRLRLDIIPACIDALYKSNALSMLQKLEIALTREQYVGTIRGIIEGASDNLEELSIYRFNESPFNQMRYDFVSWTPLPALRHLTVGVSYAYIFAEIPHWADYTLSLLKRFPPACPALDTITLIAAEPWRFLGPPKVYSPTETWTLLEQFCAIKYPSLRTLEFVFEDSTIPSDDSDDVSSDISDDYVQHGSALYSDEEDEVTEEMKGPVNASDRLGVTSLTILVMVKRCISHF